MTPIRKKKKKLPKSKKTRSRKPSPRSKVAPRKKSKPASKKKPLRRKPSARGTSTGLSIAALEPAGLGARSAGQSGDLQGLSNIATADSESVDELLEEGNAFEAEVLEGVENAPDADRGEVTTHEVLEDDVPGEYLKDQ